MSREIPGQYKTDFRELYIECAASATDLTDFVEASINGTEKSEQPSSGGVLDEATRIVDPKNRGFLGISYRGDLEGWRRILRRHCEEQGLNCATIDQDQFTVMSCKSESFPLSDCHVDFDPKLSAE